MDNSKTGLELLRQPFPPHQISKLPKPMKKREEMDKLPKAKCLECGGYHATSSIIHLDYVGHAALTDRLLDADPNWTWEPLAIGPDGLPVFDKTGGLWIKLTVCGVTRMGYGNAELNSYADVGSREKEVIGDALRNAAMRFGAALDLWHKGDLHLDDEEPEKKKPKSKPDPRHIESLVKDEVITPDQAIFIEDLLNEHGKTKAAFLAKTGISSIGQLPADKYEKAIALIKG